MAGYLNKVQIIGRLGKDPEVRTFQNGGRVASLSVATSTAWKDKATGEKKERTEWHRVSIMADGLVGIAERFLNKGDSVYVEGQLETRKYQDKDGRDCYTTEIVLRPYNGTLTMLGSKAQRGGESDNAEGDYQAGAAPAGGGIDDEIPF